jgi:hypothetical protein
MRARGPCGGSPLAAAWRLAGAIRRAGAAAGLRAVVAV